MKAKKKEIGLGIEKGLDVNLYAKPKFTYWQMFEIRNVLENNIDVTLYLNPNIKWEEMQRIRLELERNK